MAYREYGYSIDDIDILLSDYIKSQQLTIKQDGKDIRIKVIISTPEEVYSKKTIPCICIESGFLETTPYDWIHEPAISLVSNTGGKNSYTKEELVTIYYSYKIGYYVTDPRNANYINRALLSLLPVNFTLPLVKEQDEYCIAFLRDQSMVKLDEIYDGVKIYRRDIVLKTTLHFASYEIIDYLQARGVIIKNIIKGE